MTSLLRQAKAPHQDPIIDSMLKFMVEIIGITNFPLILFFLNHFPFSRGIVFVQYDPQWKNKRKAGKLSFHYFLHTYILMDI